MVETCMDHILKKAQRDGKIDAVSENAIGKIKQMKEIFKDDKPFLKVMNMHMMLRKLETLKTERIGEFRKNVALKIIFKGKEVNVNLEQLKIYAEMMEGFINTTKEFLGEK